MEAKTIRFLLAVLLGLSWALPATATDDEASAYLPLAVGNSWTYGHEYNDLDNQQDIVERYLPCTLDVVLVAFSDTTAERPMSRRDCGRSTTPYHEHDLFNRTSDGG